jgi:hypothetical protein
MFLRLVFMQQQQRQARTRPRQRRTIAEWGLLILSLGLAILLSLTRPSLPSLIWHRMLLAQWWIFLAFIGYSGTGLVLLFNVRRVAALFLAICTLAWWCLCGWEFGQTQLPDGKRLEMFVACGVCFLIGVLHILLARWLWRQESVEE